MNTYEFKFCHTCQCAAAGCLPDEPTPSGVEDIMTRGAVLQVMDHEDQFMDHCDGCNFEALVNVVEVTYFD